MKDLTDTLVHWNTVREFQIKPFWGRFGFFTCDVTLGPIATVLNLARISATDNAIIDTGATGGRPTSAGTVASAATAPNKATSDGIALTWFNVEWGVFVKQARMRNYLGNFVNQLIDQFAS